MRRELKRNGQLRQICGFDILGGIKAVPGQCSYTRFLSKLIKQREEVDKMFNELLGKIKEKYKDLVKRCKYWLADRGLDDGKMIIKLWDKHKIKPVIDIRNTWKDS